nr:NADH dehydrogenase subunit 4L [Kradibia gibbosae]
MYSNYYLYIFMFMYSATLFCYLFNQVLPTLIMLEFMMLSLLLLLSLLSIKLMNYMIILYYLIFVVCESVYGLMMLILLMRSYGNNNVKTLNLNLW